MTDYSPQPPLGDDDLQHIEPNTNTYLDMRYAMLLEIITLYFRYAEPQIAYNHVIDELVAEFDHLAEMLNYQNSQDLKARLAADEEEIASMTSDEYFNQLDAHRNTLAPLDPLDFNDLLDNLYSAYPSDPEG